MKIAGYNGFPFHHLMFGFLIYYCKTKNYELVIYSQTENDMGYINFYKQIFGECFEIRHISKFHEEWTNYDAYVCLTDDDPEFLSLQYPIFHKTICIDHYYKKRQNKMQNCLSYRLHSNELQNNWILVCYPIFNEKIRWLPTMNVVIIGHMHYYKTTILNRLRYNGKIVLHCISREINESMFQLEEPLRGDIQLMTYQNLDTGLMIELVKNSDFIMTNVEQGSHHDYESEIMSGCIPLAYSTLTPLILSKRNNQSLKFKNVIEFDRDSNDPIDLNIIIPTEEVKKERDVLMKHTSDAIDELLERIMQQS